MSVSATGSSMLARRLFAVVFILVALSSLTGCYFGRSYIQASNGGSYDIYEDGNYICSTGDECAVTTRGALGTHVFEAQKGNTVVGHKSISRSITVASILLMPFTFYLSPFLYQAYPDEIVIYIDESALEESRNDRTGSSGTSDHFSGGSDWEKPIF